MDARDQLEACDEKLVEGKQNSGNPATGCWTNSSKRLRDGVVFATSVINRDQDVYTDPDTLDWHRPARHHVAFGFGIHQCLGQNLTRAELEIALRTLFDRLSMLRLAVPAHAIAWKPGDTIQGMLVLPVTW